MAEDWSKFFTEEPKPKRKPKPAEAPPPPNPLKLRAKAFQASRRFSQNFLIDAGVLDGIVRCMNLTKADTVLEIGPGLGFLTERLIPVAGKVLAVELDKRLADGLHRAFSKEEHFELTQGDFLRYDLNQMGTQPFKVVGNLPYNITSDILFKLVGEVHQATPLPLGQIQQMTVMVQKEVAERMSAKPGSKVYGPLSIALQYRYQVEPEFDVLPAAFEPRPGVTSTVISLLPRNEPMVALEDASLFRRLVRAGFQQRRKTLKNSLAHGSGVSEEILEAAMASINLSLQERPEQVPISQWGALANAVHGELCKGVLWRADARNEEHNKGV
jgi:16S rRNA (adenine1518-N6/adenine1519-N6)-dimethyltransferase